MASRAYGFFAHRSRSALDEYLGLRMEAAWYIPSREIAVSALNRSLYSVVAVRDQAVIGCARLVGDGLYVYLQDVIVKVAARSAGVGTALVSRCMEAAVSVAPSGSGCIIALMAAPSLESFYNRFGFRATPEQLSLMYIRQVNSN